MTPLIQTRKNMNKTARTMMVVIAIAIKKVKAAKKALLLTVLAVIMIRTQVEITLNLGRVSRSAILKRRMARTLTSAHLQTKKMTKKAMKARNKRMNKS